jgi:hypothetical protein
VQISLADATVEAVDPVHAADRLAAVATPAIGRWRRRLIGYALCNAVAYLPVAIAESCSPTGRSCRSKC